MTVVICDCCEEEEALEYDPHVGDVCMPCYHMLRVVGQRLTDDPALHLSHPEEIEDDALEEEDEE